MPILNGYDMSLKIKNLISEFKLQDVPIISYSSNEINPQEIKKQKLHKIDNQMMKPANFKKLKQMFDIYLKLELTEVYK